MPPLAGEANPAESQTLSVTNADELPLILAPTPLIPPDTLNHKSISSMAGPGELGVGRLGDSVRVVPDDAERVTPWGLLVFELKLEKVSPPAVQKKPPESTF